MSRRTNRTPVGESSSGQNEAFELEEQNDNLLDGLSAKVSALHNVSININDEVHSQNRLLEGSVDTFGRFGSMFDRTRHRLTNTLATANKRFLCYLTLALVFTVFALYFIGKHLLSKVPRRGELP
ncbi:protein transport protein bet1 [Coemansia sp. RSA 1365]|nr:protein transport protein bet1 [Coemansia sp. RSA 1365]